MFANAKIKRIGIDLLIVIGQVLCSGSWISNPNYRDDSWQNILIRLGAIFFIALIGAYLLLQILNIKNKWILLIDLAVIALSTVIVGNLLSYALNPNDSFSTLVQMSFMMVLPICLAINGSAFGIAKAFYKHR